MPKYLFENIADPTDVISVAFPMGTAPQSFDSPLGVDTLTSLRRYRRIFGTPYVTTTTFADDPRNKEALKIADARRDQREQRYAQQWDR